MFFKAIICLIKRSINSVIMPIDVFDVERNGILKAKHYSHLLNREVFLLLKSMVYFTSRLGVPLVI